MTIADSNNSLDEGELCSWVGHVHYDNGTVKEVNVITADRRDKIIALSEVCKAAGIASPNSSGVKGVILGRSNLSGERHMFGSGMRESAKPVGLPSNVVELRPVEQRFRVTAYPSPSAGYTVVRDVKATSSVAALEGVLKTVGVQNMHLCGDYVVQKYEEQDTLRVVLKKGTIPGATAAAMPTPTTMPVPYKSPQETVIDSLKALLSHERIYSVPRTEIIRKETGDYEPTV